MTSTTVYQINENDLREFLNEAAHRVSLVKSNDRFRNTLVGVSWIAELHGVSKTTVINYINDGLIIPEVRNVEKGKYYFKADYAISLDFALLKKQMLNNKYSLQCLRKNLNR